MLHGSVASAWHRHVVEGGLQDDAIAEQLRTCLANAAGLKALDGFIMDTCICCLVFGDALLVAWLYLDGLG